MDNKSYSKGISWIDDCRIPHSEEIMIASSYKETKQSENGWGTKNRILEPSNRGRFPANILVSDDMLNDGLISKSKSGGISSGVNFGGETTKYRNRIGHDDKGTNSRYYDIDKWFDKIVND